MMSLFKRSFKNTHLLHPVHGFSYRQIRPVPGPARSCKFCAWAFMDGWQGLRLLRGWQALASHDLELCPGLGSSVQKSVNQTEYGFTLVELLIVLILIGLVSTMVFVAVGSGMLKTKESRFVTQFTQTLVHARSASLARGEVVRFVIYGPERLYAVQGKRPDSIPKTIKVEGKGISEFKPGVYVVYFFPDGSSSGGEIDLKWSDGRIDRVDIDRFLGIIRTRHIT